MARAESCGLPGPRTSPETPEHDPWKVLAAPGPSVAVLPAVLLTFAPRNWPEQAASRNGPEPAVT